MPECLSKMTYKNLFTSFEVTINIYLFSVNIDVFLNGTIMILLFVGNLLSGGGSVPAPKASAETWVNMINEFQMGALSTRLGIPLLYGIDAVHGHNNAYNSTIFPHNIGMGVTRQVMFFPFNSLNDGHISLFKYFSLHCQMLL